MIDVIIVGAGPAGTAAAFDLLENGFSVLILDKVAFPRKKACAGGITPKGYNLFKYDISSQVKRECPIVKISSDKNKAFTINEKKPLCYMTNRPELDLFSLNKVIEKGAVFKIVKKIKSIEKKSGFIEIKTSSGRFQAAYLIGADGANSTVRRLITKKKYFKKQRAIEVDVKVDHPEQFPMEFDFSGIKKGYFWIFPKGDHLNVGIYSIDSNAKLNTSDLFKFIEKKVGKCQTGAVKGYPICTGGVSYQPESNRILLVGDAAGFAEPLFGEGIYFAVLSGQIAAQAIIDHGASSDCVKDCYSNKLKIIQNDLRIHDLSAAFFYRWPWISLKIAAIPFFRNRFVKGYLNGQSLTEMILNK